MGTADKANAFIRAASPETGLHVDQMPEVLMPSMPWDRQVWLWKIKYLLEAGLQDG